MAVQWLRLGTLTAEGPGSIPDWRTKIAQAEQHSHPPHPPKKQKKNQKDTQKTSAAGGGVVCGGNRQTLWRRVCPPLRRYQTPTSSDESSALTFCFSIRLASPGHAKFGNRFGGLVFLYFHSAVLTTCLAPVF